MNPIFDPGTSGAPQFVPGTNPSLFGGDPGTVGGGGGGATAGGGGVPNQYAARDQTSLGLPGLPRPTPAPGGQQYAYDPSNLAAMAAWNPAAHPGRRAPTVGSYRPSHQGPAGMDWSRYNAGGNMGNSAMGAQGNYRPVDAVGDYPWMTDQSTQWGGGPFGYLPINYQPQNFGYYNQPGVNYAPWETKYATDTFTQNYAPQQPGYINTRDPAVMGRTRG